MVSQRAAAVDLNPVIIQQSIGDVAFISISNTTSLESRLDMLSLVSSDSDFVPRKITMTFEPDQRLLTTNVAVLEDTRPEDAEVFMVRLVNPTNGAEVGANDSVQVNILPNDDAFGIIQFAADSRFVRQIERSGEDNSVRLNIERLRGNHGRVEVAWDLITKTGTPVMTNDVTPTVGSVVFVSGAEVSTISLLIRDDALPEMDKEFTIRLKNVTVSGTGIPGKGATLGVYNTSTMVIMASDSPNGVVSWEKTALATTEPEGSDATVTLHVIREQGSKGTIQVSYITSRDMSKQTSKQATAGDDYVAKQETVSMAPGVNRTAVTVVIKHDDLPEQEESFLVNITSVHLMGAPATAGVGPSIKKPGDVATVSIGENDVAGGVIQFDVAKNANDQIDTYEGEVLRLPVNRTKGTFGDVTISWRTIQNEASSSDYKPNGGYITFTEGQTMATINITIVDDTITEGVEKFEVHLFEKVSGPPTAFLGDKRKVTVAIRKNDSPNGMFGFVEAQQSVREPANADDPGGNVTFNVQRLQGTEGTVVVTWRLSENAKDDFQVPLTGSLTFKNGEVKHAVTLRTKGDSILEGDEKFTISLVSADNNADINPKASEAAIIILADKGANGIIQIVPSDRSILIGEPSASYDGKATIGVTRGIGKFGEVIITWQITERDTETFLALQGMVTFKDGQENQTIEIQTKDDTVPELKHLYALEITSATGGAIVSTEPGARKSIITMVASDYPHGLFQFAAPQEKMVSEDDGFVSLTIKRDFGTVGQVKVSYTTWQSTAKEGEDFTAESGEMTFANGEREQKLQVSILQDIRPEGPEEFCVNITKVELLSSTNNYTSIGGLAMDMAPEIGPLVVKKVIITKNDNAEGTLEFNSSAVNMLVKEDAGVARIPVIRTGGSYGKVSVKYEAANQTAKHGEDYILQKGEVEFGDGVTSAFIQVVILNDNLREFGESFEVKLTAATGGASLGSRTNAVVTIDKSDYPNGKFTFVGTTNLIIPNPSTDQVRTFFLERSGGTLGKQTVHWRIMGFNDKNKQVFDTNDVSYNISGTEVTSGSLVWADGELGQKNIALTIKPHTGPEIQKIFLITIYDIVGSPATSGHGEVGPLAGSAELTILKHGDPNGIVRFADAATEQRSFSEPLTSPTEVAFPLYRREGTIGDIKVHWRVTVPSGSNNDTLPMSGVAVIQDKKRIGTIYTYIQPDDEPELTEELTMELVKIEGGAEIDTVFNTSKIAITYNDDPHGVFAVFTQYQSVVVNADMSRSVKVNVTRLAGSVGKVRVTFTVAFDQSFTGPATSSGTIEFENGEASASKLVPVGKNIFMAVNSTFTITLTNVEFNGIGVTIPPMLSATDKTCKASVPESAANSQVGFAQPVIQIDEANNEAEVTLTRIGTYGSLDVEWLTGFPTNEIPTGFTQGNVLTAPSKISFTNGEKTQSFKISVLPNNQGTPELFAIHLPKAPTSGTDGGAQLWSGHTLLKFDNQGLVQFASNSREVTVDENIGTMELTLERVYGSEGSIQVQYRTSSVAQGATGGQDFTHVSEGKQNFDEKQTRAIIMIRILLDNIPEVAEHFFVDVIAVVPLPTGSGNGESPRVSRLFYRAKVVISKNNYPNGLLYLTPPALSVNEGANTLLSIMRTGGLYGDIRVTVRTMGAGEIFNHSDGEIRPTADHSDFVPFSTVVLFENGTAGPRSVSLQIRSDTDVEQDETLVVYLTNSFGGAAILQGNTINGQKNYSLVTIKRSGQYNGVVSFVTKTAYIDEDGSAEANLVLSRTASFYDLTVEWIAKLALDSNEQQDADMLDPVTKKGSTVCRKGESQCKINVKIKKDETPERKSSFYIILTNTDGGGASINQNLKSCKVVVNASDYPDGLIQFTEKSRFITANNSQTIVHLEVLRTNGVDGEVAVEFYSWQPVTSTVAISGITVQQGVSGQDFTAKRGTVTFGAKDTGPKSINVTLTPFNGQSSNVYPKVFYVSLEKPTNGASIGHSQAQILISKPGEDKLWGILAEANAGTLDDARINSVLTRLKDATNPTKKLVASELDVVDNTLDLIIKQAENRTVPLSVQQGVMDVFCNLVNPTRDDTTMGHSQLSRLVERFAFTFLLDQKCQTENLIRFDHCASIRLAMAKWYPENINGYKYQADRNARDYFKLPSTLLPTISAPNKQCEAIQFLEYSSEQWFMEQKDKVLMNNKVITFKIQGQSSKMLESPIVFRIYTQDRKIAPNRAQCVYNLDTSVGWEVRQDICYVVNNLNLAVDDYVECSCKHMTSYAVKANTNNPDLIGYPIWFSISCFICMFGLLLAVLSHHLCSVYSMFAANLLMHFCFAAFATQLCYVIDAFLSPDYLLASSVDQDNYRCIVMGVFTHYFALAQFTWLLAQALNFWKILVLNDEHTDRKYAVYLLIGWGLPVVIVATFYVITFCLYHYVYKEDAKFIYGDVNNNGDICFITNPYAALGGVIAPALIFIMVLAVVFIQSFQVTPQWQAYDDIYRGRYNVNEVRILLLFFTIVILTWLWGGLHLAFSHVWWLVLFCIFNIIQGLYALVVYTILRNPCLPCLRPQKQSYAVSVNMNGDTGGHYPHHDGPSLIDSIKGSKISLVHNDMMIDDWDQDSLTHVGGMRVKRTPPVNGNIFSIYDNKMPIPAEDDREDQDLDDLIFALKTGALTPSESSNNFEKDFDQSTTITGPPHDPFMGEMRRISIADTHL
ncbi:adhesion G-protein coupled receptor V1-like [Lineus longissimus]|uniref:adhesion G-protein coupled receptor V1-like n=1 Tax=Lineus longissimus TaxID=88925 RepID=UPI00315C860E